MVVVQSANRCRDYLDPRRSRNSFVTLSKQPISVYKSCHLLCPGDKEDGTLFETAILHVPAFAHRLAATSLAYRRAWYFRGMSLFRPFRLHCILGLFWAIWVHNCRLDGIEIVCETTACIFAPLGYHETQGTRYQPHTNGVSMSGKATETRSSILLQQLKHERADGGAANTWICRCTGTL